MAKRLVVSDGSREREMMIVGRLVVGRDPACDITYDDALLSRRHAEFVASGDEVIVRDLGSRNGVFVNGAKIAERTLRSGDIVQIGPVRARYVADAAPVGIAPEQVDAEYTAVIASPGAPAPPPAPVAAAAISLPTSEMVRPAPAPPSTDDDDRTRMIQGPRAAQAAEPAPPAAAPPAAALPPTAADEDDDRTHFLKSPVARPPSAPATATSGTGAQARPTSASSIAPPATPRPAVPPLAAVLQDHADHADGATMIVPRTAAAQRPAPPSAAPAPAVPAPPAARPQPVAPQPVAAPPPPAVTPRPPASRPSPSIPQPTASVRATANPQSAIPQSAIPQSANPQLANPQLANPQLANPQSAIRNPQSEALSSYVAARVVVLVVIVLAAAAVPLIMWRSAPEQMSLIWLAVPVAAAAIAAFAISAQINQRFAHALAAAERNRS